MGQRVEWRSVAHSESKPEIRKSNLCHDQQTSSSPGVMMEMPYVLFSTSRGICCVTNVVGAAKYKMSP